MKCTLVPTLRARSSSMKPSRTIRRTPVRSRIMYQVPGVRRRRRCVRRQLDGVEVRDGAS